MFCTEYAEGETLYVPLAQWIYYLGNSEIKLDSLSKQLEVKGENKKKFDIAAELLEAEATRKMTNQFHWL